MTPKITTHGTRRTALPDADRTVRDRSGIATSRSVIRPCRSLLLAVVIVAISAFLSITAKARAADFLEGFDGPKISWQILSDPRLCKVVDHRRQAQLRRSGTAAEKIILDAKSITRVELLHRLSPARALDELTATVWVRSNRTGAKLALRLVFPHLNDPQTGQRLFRWIEGDTYTADNTWQSLTCQTSKKEVQRRMQLLRATLGANVELKDAYVDRAMIFADIGEGTTELCFDELKLGPVVSPSTEVPLMPEEAPRQADFADIKMQQNRLVLNGQPFFPTFLPDHGEAAEELADIGFKLAWVPQYDDLQRLQAFRKAGLGCIATPPVASSPEGEVLDADSAGLAPLGEEFDPIWFWMLGNGIAPNDRLRLASWQKQMLSADRRRQRPLMAGVTGGERSFSRVVSMLGMSRSVQQTGVSYLAYRDWLSDRQAAARPGIFRWTWIDAEPSRDIVATRRARRLAIPVIEPDQLKLQVYSALSSGVQGLGFWSTEGLFREETGANESQLMLKQLHFELRLLEPWLATGSVVDHKRFELAPSAPPPIAAGKKRGVTPVGYLVPSTKKTNGKLPASSPTIGGKAVAVPHLEATLIDSSFGTLLLGTWYDPNSQFVPGQMTAQNVRIVVPGLNETAKAWEITTTEIRPLKTDRNAVPGGTLICLEQFDTTTAIVISSDLSLGDKLRAQVVQMQGPSAQTLVQLARIKLQRVEAVIQAISKLGHSQADDGRMLTKSRRCLEQAIQSLERKEYIKAREQADLTLRMIRVMQRAHWDAARESLVTLHIPQQLGQASDWGFRGPLNGQAGPTKIASNANVDPFSPQQLSEQESELKALLIRAHVSGPHTMSFQTLPDHWGLFNRLQSAPLPSFTERELGVAPQPPRNPRSPNIDLLGFNDFERDAEFREGGWEHLQNAVPNVVATAELVQPPDRRGYCLRLAAAPSAEKGVPYLIPAPPVTFMTPGIPVQAGQVFRIHGWIKVLRPITGSRDGFELEDSIGGPDAASHWNAITPEWTRFEILREAHEADSLSLSFILHGLGEVLIDDVKIEQLQLRYCGRGTP